MWNFNKLVSLPLNTVKRKLIIRGPSRIQKNKILENIYWDFCEKEKLASRGVMIGNLKLMGMDRKHIVS